MQLPQNLSESDRHWYDIIQQCRTSGLCDNQWLQENNIKSATFYYHVKQLRKKACDLPVLTGRSNRHNEVKVSDKVFRLCRKAIQYRHFC